MACHVYDNKYCKVVSVACCDMHSKDAHAQTCFWENGVSKDFMADNAQSTWIVVRKIYGDGAPSVPLQVASVCVFSIAQPIKIRSHRNTLWPTLSSTSPEFHPPYPPFALVVPLAFHLFSFSFVKYMF